MTALVIVNGETRQVQSKDRSAYTQKSDQCRFLWTASLWFTGRTLFYSILRFAAAQSPLSNCKQSPYWILFCPLRIDTPTFQTKSIFPKNTNFN